MFGLDPRGTLSASYDYGRSFFVVSGGVLDFSLTTWSKVEYWTKVDVAFMARSQYHWYAGSSPGI